MEKLLEARLEINKKLVSKGLPKVMYLYAVDVDHFILTAKEVIAMKAKALAKALVNVVDQENDYILVIPKRIYDFYRLDENDYTIMVSEKKPESIVISV